jgi:hypothetical protein
LDARVDLVGCDAAILIGINLRQRRFQTGNLIQLGSGEDPVLVGIVELDSRCTGLWLGQIRMDSRSRTITPGDDQPHRRRQGQEY